MNSQTEDQTDSDHSSGQGQEDEYAAYRDASGKFTAGAGRYTASKRGQESDSVSDSGQRVKSSASPVSKSDNPRTREGKADEGDGFDAWAVPFDDLWRRLTRSQKRYVYERVTTTTKAAAAKAIGLHRSTIYKWPTYVEVAADRIIDESRDAITENMRKSALKSTDVLERMLDNANLDDVGPREAVKAAMFLIEQQSGKATQKQEIAHSGSIGVSDQDVADMASALDHLSTETEAEDED